MTIIRIPEERNLDKLIGTVRLTAVRDKVTVVIERTITRRDGSTHKQALLEVDPTGTVSECPPPMLRATIAARLTDLDLTARTDGMNRRSLAGHERLAELVRVSRDYLRAEADFRRPATRARKAATLVVTLIWMLLWRTA